MPVTFMTFNLRYNNAKDGVDAWEFRKKHVADLIKTKRPDCIGFQEPLIEQVIDLQNQLDEDYEWVGVGRTDGNQSGELNPIFFRRDRLQLQDWGTYWLSSWHQKLQRGSMMDGACLPRIMTWCRFQFLGEIESSSEDSYLFNTCHKPFYFFNTHWDHLDEEVRANSASLVLKLITHTAGLYPAVLVGDFNCESDSVSFQQLTSTFLKDSRSHAQLTENADYATFINFRSGKHSKTPWPDGACRIDHILYSGWFVHSYSILTDVRPDGGRCLSDHRPVMAAMDINV